MSKRWLLCLRVRRHVGLRLRPFFLVSTGATFCMCCGARFILRSTSVIGVRLCRGAAPPLSLVAPGGLPPRRLGLHALKSDGLAVVGNAYIQETGGNMPAIFVSSRGYLQWLTKCLAAAPCLSVFRSHRAARQVLTPCHGFCTVSLFLTAADLECTSPSPTASAQAAAT